MYSQTSDTDEFIISQADLEQLGFEFVSESLRRPDGSKLVSYGPPPNQLGREINLKIANNVNAADTTNADELSLGGKQGLNLTGKGVEVAVWDEGRVRQSHQELRGRVKRGDNSRELSDHATHVAGTIGARGVNPKSLGMAPQVIIRSYDFNNDIPEIESAIGSVKLSNHSYGYIGGWESRIDWGIGAIDTWYEERDVYYRESPAFGKYSSRAAALDQIMHNRPYFLSIWSAGNDRQNRFTNINNSNSYITYLNTGVDGPGWYEVNNAGPTKAPPPDGNGGAGYDSLNIGDKVAKNNLVIGAINDIVADPYSKTNVQMTSFSNWGPTDDGRIKPDLVANGVSLYSSTANSDRSYANFSGTSMATPNVTGSIALLYEQYQNLRGRTPLSATTKALVIHTAFDAGKTGPDYSYGWGVLDIAAATQLLTEVDSNSISGDLHEDNYRGSQITYQVSTEGNEPLKATLVWTDPPGKASPYQRLDDPKPVLVNDLNLSIIGPTGDVYYPWTLEPQNPKLQAKRNQPNHLDNIEQVLIDRPLPGDYQVLVNHSGKSFRQNFSLVISGTAESFSTPVSPLLEGVDRRAILPLELTEPVPPGTKIKFKYRTVNKTAKAGQDYRSKLGEIVLRPGQQVKNISIGIINDRFGETDEAFRVRLRQISGPKVNYNFTEWVTISDTWRGEEDIILPQTVENAELLGRKHLTVTGNKNDNLIQGNRGNNLLQGNPGNDLLLGYQGRDTLEGGRHNDTLTGGVGNDRFTYATSSSYRRYDFGKDTITDFGDRDRLVLSKTTFTKLTSDIGNRLNESSDLAVVARQSKVDTENSPLVFSSSNSTLYYNENGSKPGFGRGGPFVVLAGVNDLQTNDFALIT